jgi:homogentisate phytyltransferase/homogentisate geranylgeranyltransferase
MLLAYGGAVGVGLLATTSTASCVVTVGLHVGLAATMWIKSQKVDLQDSKALYAFYMLIWKLFYAEYFLLPLLR